MKSIKKKKWLSNEHAGLIQTHIDKGEVVFGLGTDGVHFWEVPPTMAIVDMRIVLTHTYLTRIGVKSPVPGLNSVFVSGECL